MDNKYKEMLKALDGVVYNATINAETIINVFDDEIFEVVQHLKNNHASISQNEWVDLYKKYQDKPDVMLSIIKYPECPRSILEIIVADAIYKAGKSFSYYDSSAMAKILKSSISFDLPANLFNEVFDLDPVCFLSIIISDNYSVSQNAFETFAQYIVKHPEPIERSASLSYNTMTQHLEQVFSKISDKNTIYSMIKQVLTIEGMPTIKTALLNNKLLDPTLPFDEKIINDLFESGIHYQSISNFTPLICDYYVSNFTNIDDYSPNYVSEITKELIALLRGNNVPQSIEYDLMMKLMNYPNIENTPSLNNLKTYILSYTKNEDIMKLVCNLSPGERRDILFKNQNIPEQIFSDVVSDICNEIKQNDNNLLNSNCKDLSYYCSLITFKDEDYDFLLNNFFDNKMLVKSLSSSEHTPEKYLNKIIDSYDKIIKNNYNPNSEISKDAIKGYLNSRVSSDYLKAEVNLLLKSEKINSKQFDILKYIISIYTDYFASNKPVFKDFVANIDLSNNSVLESFSNFSEEEIETFKNAMNNFFNNQKPIEEPMATVFQNFETVFKYYYEVSFLAIGKNELQYFNDAQINRKLQSISREIFGTILTQISENSEPEYCFVKFYENLPEIYKEYQLFHNEHEKRLKEKTQQEQVL